MSSTEDDDDRRIARGNPWARAVAPDDDKAKAQSEATTLMSAPAAMESTTIPFENTRRSPRFANCRGR